MYGYRLDLRGLRAGIGLAVFVIANTPTSLYPLWQLDIEFSSRVLTLIFAAHIAGLLLTLVSQVISPTNWAGGRPSCPGSGLTGGNALTGKLLSVSVTNWSRAHDETEIQNMADDYARWAATSSGQSQKIRLGP